MSLFSIWHNFELPGQKFYAFGQIFNVVTHFCATFSLQSYNLSCKNINDFNVGG